MLLDSGSGSHLEGLGSFEGTYIAMLRAIHLCYFYR